ncbi:hypothetical protein K0M31_000004, partial [Melipona bicolor]
MKTWTRGTRRNGELWRVGVLVTSLPSSGDFIETLSTDDYITMQGYAEEFRELCLS